MKLVTFQISQPTKTTAQCLIPIGKMNGNPHATFLESALASLCFVLLSSVSLPCFAQHTTFIPTSRVVDPQVVDHQSRVLGWQALTPLDQILNPDGSVRLEVGFSGALDVQGWQMRTGPDGKPRFLRSAEGGIPEDSLWDDTFGYPGMNNVVFALGVMGTNLYAGGVFTTAGGVSANRIARWNGTSWSVLGSGMNSTVLALAVLGTDLYAGGAFTTAGSVSANYIAKWDGTSWSALGSGMNAIVYALAVIGTDLYAGGIFTTAGGVSANRIARWNGTTWSALGSGMNSTVFALAVIGTDLYAGGGFTTAGSVSANYIARWDGTSWSALGSGMNSTVLALAVIGTDLYAGGGFTTAGGVSANRIARWNGISWSALGSGMNGGALALAAIGTDLYVGGVFTTAGSVSANYIARWDGTSWSALGSGMNGAVYALAAIGSELYVGGSFTTAGGNPSSYIGLWHLPDVVGVSEQTPAVPAGYVLGQNYPNPFNPSTKIRFHIPTASRVSLRVFDLLGKEVALLVNEQLSGGSYITEWNATGFASGVYLYRLQARLLDHTLSGGQAGNFAETKKLVLLR